MILAPNEMKAASDDKKAAAACLDFVKLDPDLYRVGHTKARRLSTKWGPTNNDLEPFRSFMKHFQPSLSNIRQISFRSRPWE